MSDSRTTNPAPHSPDLTSSSQGSPVVPAEWASRLPNLLSEAPDPGAARLFLDRLLSDSPGDIRELLWRHPLLLHYAILVFGHSRFLGEVLVQNPDLLRSLVGPRSLDRSFSVEEWRERLARFRASAGEKDIACVLAQFKRQEYVRIMLRDVLRIAALAETTCEISALSDVLIEAALGEAERKLQARFCIQPTVPQATGFAVVSLGKLGGNELNYSSDVDLMYVFGEAQQAPAPLNSRREYFLRLAHQVTDILSRVTEAGAVFRIDLRLRPQGNEGELAISVSQALRYYATTAQDWERQALIKARCSAGDAGLAREFILGVQPYVYRAAGEQATLREGQGPAHNFAALTTSLSSREKASQRRRSGQGLDVKRDRGGIRDIEFLVQSLQRVYGAAEPWLRSGGTLFALQKLYDKHHLSTGDFHELARSYELLRHVEHRLQLRYGHQTHRLPGDGPELNTLQRSMSRYLAGETEPDIVGIVKRRMEIVSEIEQRVVRRQQERRDVALHLELRPPHPESALEQSHQLILERLAIDAPELHALATQTQLSAPATKNLMRFLEASFASSSRYVILTRHSKSLMRGLEIFETSDYLSSILIRHPEEIATLEELRDVPDRSGSGQLFDSHMLAQVVSDPVLSYLSSWDLPYPEKLAVLRRHYRHRVFAIGARDVLDPRDVYESLGCMTAAAEDVIRAAFGLVGAPKDLAVMALGRLGSGESDLLSDVDLLFICDERADRLSLTKAAERMMQALSSHTRDGIVFPVDTRLRPRGREGDLLVTPAQLQVYFEREAQPWEALVYTKLRFVAGSRSLKERTLSVARLLFGRFAANPQFAGSIRDMRAKLEAAEAGSSTFKGSAGGIYDIDFLCGFLAVRAGVPAPGTLRDRIWRTAERGEVTKTDAAALDHAAELYRTADHIVRLATGRVAKWLPENQHSLEATEQMARRVLRREFPRSLATELSEGAADVRRICEGIMGKLS